MTCWSLCLALLERRHWNIKNVHFSPLFSFYKSRYYFILFQKILNWADTVPCRDADAPNVQWESVTERVSFTSSTGESYSLHFLRTYARPHEPSVRGFFQSLGEGVQRQQLLSVSANLSVGVNSLTKDTFRLWSHYSSTKLSCHLLPAPLNHWTQLWPIFCQKATQISPSPWSIWFKEINTNVCIYESKLVSVIALSVFFSGIWNLKLELHFCPCELVSNWQKYLICLICSNNSSVRSLLTLRGWWVSLSVVKVCWFWRCCMWDDFYLSTVPAISYVCQI